MSNKKDSGICFYCKFKKNCSLRNNDSGLIWNCEDYCDGEYEEIDRNKFLNEKRGELKDLCYYCINFEKCNLPKGEGGVWYCEEYV